MACCLTVPSHFLYQCSLIINQILWHSPKTNFTGYAQDINAWNEYENYSCKKLFLLYFTGADELIGCVLTGIVVLSNSVSLSIWILVNPVLISTDNIDGLAQERRNSSALAMELRLSCTNASICSVWCLSISGCIMVPFTHRHAAPFPYIHYVDLQKPMNT